MTSGCHDLPSLPKKADSNKIDPELAVRYYKTAYHKSCIPCHKEIKAANKKLEMSGVTLSEKLAPAGPVTCSGCHPKEG